MPPSRYFVSLSFWLIFFDAVGNTIPLFGKLSRMSNFLFNVRYFRKTLLYPTTTYSRFLNEQQMYSNSIFKLAVDLNIGPLDCIWSALHTEHSPVCVLLQMKFSSTRHHLVVNLTMSLSGKLSRFPAFSPIEKKLCFMEHKGLLLGNHHHRGQSQFNRCITDTLRGVYARSPRGCMSASIT